MLEFFKITLFLGSVCVISCCLILAKHPRKRWAIYKNLKADDNLHHFSLLLFDSQEHPPFEDLLESGKIVIGSFSNLDDLANVLQKKFDGIYIDWQAPLDVIKTIRMQCPRLLIMLKSEIPLEAAKEIDMILAEAIFTDPNYHQIAGHLKHMRKANPHLEIFTLDYWNPQDAEMIKHIYQEQRKQGFIPYVSTIEQNELVFEPK